MPFPGTIWHVFVISEGGLRGEPWGTMRMFADANGAEMGKMLFTETCGSQRSWLAKWSAPLREQAMHASLNTPVLRVEMTMLVRGLSQRGVIVVSKPRTAMS